MVSEELVSAEPIYICAWLKGRCSGPQECAGEELGVYVVLFSLLLWSTIAKLRQHTNICSSHTLLFAPLKHV